MGRSYGNTYGSTRETVRDIEAGGVCAWRLAVCTNHTRYATHTAGYRDTVAIVSGGRVGNSAIFYSL